METNVFWWNYANTMVADAMAFFAVKPYADIELHVHILMQRS